MSIALLLFSKASFAFRADLKKSDTYLQIYS